MKRMRKKQMGLANRIVNLFVPLDAALLILKINKKYFLKRSFSWD